jgi:hypothetical protein
MSYPEPIEGESPESLYKQAKFFYDQYEKKNKEVKKLESENDKLRTQNECLLLEHCLVEGCSEREQNPLPGVKKKKNPLKKVGDICDVCGGSGCSDKARKAVELMGMKCALEKQTPPPHIHGCGHPATILILCDNPLHIVEYIEWAEDHEESEKNKKPCICFECWNKKVK